MRTRGLVVFVVLDNLARFAAAARELAAGSAESVGRGGYPPNVFAELMRLLERGGNVAGRSLALIVTVLSDGDGDNERERLSDAARAVLDAHIVLRAKRARSYLKIAGGHDWTKHQHEFPGYSKSNFQGLIEETIKSPHDVVVSSAVRAGGGTAFRPKNGKYFDENLNSDYS